MKELHNELYQIIVSKKEFYYQLRNCGMQRNLLNLFTTTPDSEEYIRLLTLVAIKFEFIGALNYVSKKSGEKKLCKPAKKTYENYLFDGFCGSIQECELEIRGDKDFIGKIFDKYQSTKYYCSEMMAAQNEQNYAMEYAGIVSGFYREKRLFSTYCIFHFYRVS